MFEPVIATIAFAFIMLIIAVVAVAAYVRRRMSWRAAADDVPAEDHAPRGRARHDRSRVVNE